MARALGAHRWSGRGRAWITLALPAVALLLTFVLLYQTAHTAASNRRITREALRNHASVAAWELSRHADHQLLIPVMGGFLGAQLSSPAGLAGLTPRDLAHSFRYPPCRCLGGVRSAFRVDLRNGTTTFHHLVPAADSALAWVADSVRARARPPLVKLPAGGFVVRSRRGALPPAEGRTAIMVQEGAAGTPASLRAFTSEAYGMAVGTRSGKASLVLYALVNDSAGRPVAALGVETEPAAFLGPVFTELLREVRLLPPTVARGVPNDSILAFGVMAADGRPLYASARLPEVVGARSALAPQLGEMGIVAGVRPSQAGRLVAGTVPASRVSLQIGMAVLAAALFAAGLVLLRRERELYEMRAGFVTGVSHELRTPLAQIRLFAEILASGDEADARERRHFAGIVAEEAQRLTHFVETLLAFARPAGARGAQAVPVELGVEVERAIDVIRPLCERAGTEPRFRRDEEVWALADPLALRHILLNLIDNAAKYGPRGQTVTLHTFRCGERACIAVDDEGSGVPDAERERIFKPFHRMPRHAEGQTGGSGIGLAVAREMAHQQRGSVRVESAPGGGARFVVELPLDPAPRAPSRAAPRRETVAP
ncbi:MAG TPA: HAMP domain-containing sensor histidine kinase [Longimicrobium sp.]